MFRFVVSQAFFVSLCRVTSDEIKFAQIGLENSICLQHWEAGDWETKRRKNKVSIVRRKCNLKGYDLLILVEDFETCEFELCMAARTAR